MQVELNVTRKDIIWLNVSKFFAIKSNLVVLVMIILGVSFFAWREAAWTGSEIDWIRVALSSFVGFLAIFFVSMPFVLIGSTKKSGVVGLHTFTIEDAGLREQTDANDTLNYWSAIKKIEMTPAAINVQINPWLFHILPRRSFGDDEEFHAFFDALVSAQKRESRTD